MTKKDYELIAGVYAEEMAFYDSYGDDQLDPKAIIASNAMQMADALRTTNPLFDKQRFLKACKVTQ